MSTIATLVVQLVGDTSGYYKSLEDARQTSENMSAGIVGGLSEVGGAIVTGAFAVAAASAIGLGIELKNDVQDAMDMQDANALLAATLANTSSVTGVTVGMVDQLGEKYSRLTKFSDDQIISAGGILAMYKNINSDAFPKAMQLAMDLATKMGTDLPTAARTLGKALDVPGQGLLRLNAYGLEFDAADKKMISNMEASGDIAGAQAKMMDALRGAIGGVAEVAGGTASGKWAIFNNILEQMREIVGNAVLPTLSTLATMLTTQLNRPEVQNFIVVLADKIRELGYQVVVWLPQIVTWFQVAFGWLMQNKGVIVGVLAAIGIAVGAWAYAMIAAALSTIEVWGPIVLIMAAVGAIAYVVYEAWTNNWGGIRDKVMAVIGQIVSFWNSTFLPAIQALISWWKNNLLPALQLVWEFIQNDLWPLFVAVAGFLGAVFGLAIRVLAGLWQNILLPALQAVTGWIGDKLHPIFKVLSDFINNSVMPVVTALGNWLMDHLQPAFEGISKAIQGVINFIHNLTAAINSIHLPKWLTPGSPTPFEIGLLGIQAALHQVASSGLAEFTAGLNITGPSMIPVDTGGFAAQMTPGGNYGGNNFYITGSDAEDIANKVADKLKLQGVLVHR